MEIMATCQTDDRVLEVTFDATAWFAQATDDQILALSRHNWCHCEVADTVAEHFRDGMTAGIFHYLEILQKHRPELAVGYEVKVNPAHAIWWVIQFRRHVWDIIAREKLGHD